MWEFFFDSRFLQKSSPTRQIKYKVIDFAPTKKQNVAKKASINQYGTSSKTD